MDYAKLGGMDKIEIGKRLRDLRGRTSQATLAESIGVNFNTYKKWEAGAVYPPPEMMEKMAEFYGVTLDFLYLGKESVCAEAEYGTEEAEIIRAWRLVQEKRPQTALDIHKMLMLSYTALLRGQ